MKLTEHIMIDVSETQDLVLVETTAGTTILDTSSLNELIMAFKSFYFEINPLSRLLWQFIKNPCHEILERILDHFESDPIVSERLLEYLIHLERQIDKKLSLFSTQQSKEVVYEEDEDSKQFWMLRRRRGGQAKGQWIRNKNPEELLSILAPNLPKL